MTQVCPRSHPLPTESPRCAWSGLSAARHGDDCFAADGSDFHVAVGLDDVVELVDVADRNSCVAVGDGVEEGLQLRRREVGSITGVGGHVGVCPACGGIESCCLQRLSKRIRPRVVSYAAMVPVVSPSAMPFQLRGEA